MRGFKEGKTYSTKTKEEDIRIGEHTLKKQK